METITIKGKINFKEDYYKEYDCEFTAKLTESACFHYGNGTAVIINFSNRHNSEIIDTRYNTTIKKNKEDFKKWISNYFYNNYEAHVLTFFK